MSANPDDEAIHPPNTALLFDQEQWEQTVDEEIEVTTENPSRGNIADHPLLDARQEQADAKAENPRLYKDMKDLEKRIAELEKTEGALCPLCGQELSPAERESLVQNL